MGLRYPILLRAFLSGFALVAFTMVSHVAAATNYTVSGEAPGIIDPGALTPPFSLLTGSDTLTIQSGATLATPSSSSVAYTVDISGITTDASPNIDVQSGGTISYNGSDSSGAAIRSTRADATVSTCRMDITGAVTNGTGLYSIYLSNTDLSPEDTYYIVNYGSIVGSIVTSGVKTASLDIQGADAALTGSIALSIGAGGGSSILYIRNNANFTSTASITDVGLITVSGTSILTLNHQSTDIEALTIESGSTVNLNSQISGIVSSDGAISNSGTLNIAANIAKTGTFTGSGTNVVSQAVTVATSSYSGMNHTAVLTDANNYGNMTLINSATTSIPTFEVTGGTGYFPAGTFTLLSSPVTVTVTNPITSIPNSTLFLRFDTPVVDNASTPKTIKITTNRTPFNTFASTTLTQAIGVDIESLGANSPSSSMVTLLNAIEASTTASQVEYSLEQLAPLTTAPIFGLEVQNNSMRQVQLRLAELRDRDSYFAGDIAKDNYVWLRPFGGYANQQAKDDSLGYYGSGGGIAAGFDRNLGENYNIGAAGVYALSHVKDKVNMTSSTEIKSYIGMVYGSYNFPDTHYFDWIVAVVANNFNASRVVDINGYYQNAISSYGSQQFSVKGLWGREYEAFGFMQLTPLATAQYTFAKQYEYTESGGAATNLTISRTNSNLVQLGLGAKAAVPIWVNPSIIIPELHALAFYNPVVGQQNSVFSFVDGGGQITSIFNLNRTGLFYGGALTIAVVDRLEVKANIDFDIQDRFNAYVVYLNLRYMI